MINIKPKPRSVWKKVLGGAIAFELVCFGAAYLSWRSINHSRDRRYQVYRTFPFALDAYYKLGEFIDKQNNSRELDLQAWRIEGKKL